jgi:ubiquinone/menaquinone biosynthesis C-methylase UbiE
MTATRPYEAGEYHRDLPSELQRLYRFAHLNWEKEARALRAFGLTDGMSLLEVGSGPGFYTELLTGLVPSGQVTGVEIDPALIAHAQDYLAERANSPYRFVEASVLDTGLPDDQFDFATARLVFQHVPDQPAALQEILRVLKPGGTLVLIDVDYRSANLVYPVLEPVVHILEKTAQLHALRGGDPHVGRRLWRLLERSGFDVLDLEAVALHSGVRGIEWAATQLHPDRLLPFVEKGMLFREEWQEVRDAVDRVLTHPESFYLSVMLLCGGRKPNSAVDPKGG